MKCPKCTTEMDEVRKLEVIVDSCSRCGGLWLDAGELDKLRTAVKEVRSPREADSEYDLDYDEGPIGHSGRKSSSDRGHTKHKRKKSVFDLLEIFD